MCPCTFTGDSVHVDVDEVDGRLNSAPNGNCQPAGSRYRYASEISSTFFAAVLFSIEDIDTQLRTHWYDSNVCWRCQVSVF